MKKRRHTTDQIIEKLHQADVALGKGQKVPEVCKVVEITEQTYYRWRQKYGGMAPEMAKQLKALEKENARLKKLVGLFSLDGRPHLKTVTVAQTDVSAYQSLLTEELS